MSLDVDCSGMGSIFMKDRNRYLGRLRFCCMLWLVLGWVTGCSQLVMEGVTGNEVSHVVLVWLKDDVPKEYVEVYSHGVTGVLKDFKELIIYGGKRKTFKKKLISQDKGQKEEVRLFIEAVKSGCEGPIPIEEIFSTSSVCFSILESIRKGMVVQL